MAEQLPSNHDVMSEEGDKDAREPVYCDPCKEDDKLLEVAGYCVDCNDNLCSECYQAHRRSRPSRNHVLQDRVVTSQSRSTQQRQLARCSEHQQETLDWYCTTHDKCICTLCKQMDHRNCSDVKTISEVSQDFLTSDRLKQVNDQLSQLQADFEKKLPTIKENGSAVENLYIATIEEVTKHVSRIRDEDMKKMKALEVTCDATITTIMSMVNEMETLKQNGNKEHAFIVSRKVKSQLTNLNERLHSVTKDNTITKYKYVPVSAESNSLTILGQVRAKKDFVTPVKQPDINVKTTTDAEDCNISGMEMLPGNRLVVADWNNMKVKLFDIARTTLISQLKLDVNPWDIARTEGNTIVVTSHTSQKILLISTSDKLVVQNTLQKKECTSCLGITCTNDTLVVSNRGPDQIQIMAMDGTVKQVIQAQDAHRNVRFTGDVFYMKLGPDTNILYISDFSKHKILTMTLDGQVKAEFTHEHLRNPRGVSVGNDDRVFVCSEGTNTIFEMTSDLSKGQVILDKKDGISNPRSVIYDEIDSKLYIGLYKKNTVQIFLV